MLGGSKPQTSRNSTKHCTLQLGINATQAHRNIGGTSIPAERKRENKRDRERERGRQSERTNTKRERESERAREGERARDREMERTSGTRQCPNILDHGLYSGTRPRPSKTNS